MLQSCVKSLPKAVLYSGRRVLPLAQQCGAMFPQCVWVEAQFVNDYRKDSICEYSSRAPQRRFTVFLSRPIREYDTECETGPVS
jgi:hypothetical protein